MPDRRFQIIIPTIAGRERYLLWAIRSCLTQDYSDFEVLVSNNGGSPTVRDVVSALGDPRVRYIETGSKLAMAAHWEFAVSQAAGDVCTIIGDDDALVPQALTQVDRIMSENPTVECVTHYPGQYYWPDYFDPARKNLYQLRQGTGTVEVIETKPVLKRVVEFREWYGRLPFLYHGFVERSVLERIRGSQGQIFKRSSPDIYSDLVLAAVMDRYARFDGCLTFGGQGAKSNGANWYLNNELGKEFAQDLPDYLAPKYYAGNVTIQLYEFFEMIGDLFPSVGQGTDVARMKFVRQTIQEALTTPAHCHASLKQLQKIAANDFPPLERALTWLAITPLELPWIREMAANALAKRRRSTAEAFEDAGAAFGAQNIFELVTRLVGLGVSGRPYSKTDH